jgi:hypothetical protein
VLIAIGVRALSARSGVQQVERVRTGADIRDRVRKAYLAQHVDPDLPRPLQVPRPLVPRPARRSVAVLTLHGLWARTVSEKSVSCGDQPLGVSGAVLVHAPPPCSATTERRGHLGERVARTAETDRFGRVGVRRGNDLATQVTRDDAVGERTGLALNLAIRMGAEAIRSIGPAASQQR